MSDLLEILRPKTRDQVMAMWRGQYFNNGLRTWGNTISGSSELTFNKLAALPPDATSEQIDKVVSGWSTHWCHGCKGYHKDVVQIGEPPDYESNTVVLCRACVRSIFDELKAFVEEQP